MYLIEVHGTESSSVSPKRTKLFVWRPPPPHLDDEGLVGKTGRQAQLAHVGRLVNEVLNAVKDSAAGGGDPAMYATLADGLAGHAGMGIDVLQAETAKQSSCGH